MAQIYRLSIPFMFLLLAAFALTLSVYKPYHNVDMILYIGAAKAFEEPDVGLLHSFTYDQVRQSVSEAQYDHMVAPGLKRAIMVDPTVFKEQLPFYQIRPVYTGLIYLQYKTGVNIAFATHIISGVSVIVAIGFLYLMSVSFLARPLIYAVPPLAINFHILEMARYSTPDGLAFLAIIVSAYLYLNRRITLLLILFPIMVGIRTDLILLIIPLLFFVFVFEIGSRWKASLSVIICVAAYVGIGAYWNNPGWATVFYHTLVGQLTHPISAAPSLTFQDYFYALFKGTAFILINNYNVMFLYVLIAAGSLYMIKNRAKTTSLGSALKSPPAALSVVSLVFVAGHFLLFPIVDGRYFAGAYLIGALSLLIMANNYLKASNAANKALHGTSEVDPVSQLV